MAINRKRKVTSLEEIKQVVNEHRAELKSQFHVDEIGVFGSYARGEQSKKSDIDFLVTFDKPVGYFDLAGLKIFLEEYTGRNTDIIPSYNLRPEFRSNVQQEIIYI